MTTTLTTLARYQSYLAPTYRNLPQGRYVSLIVIRKTQSETIFRTEGSGEGLVKETVFAGLTHQQRIRRVMISKRKQTAVERRTGRELLREHSMLKMAGKTECSMNTNAPCGKCIDCMLYGYAVGGGGAQKSRVMTDDAFSIASAAAVTSSRTFNATFENGTMRNPITNEASTSINEDEYVIPETHFLDIETLKDVTAGELIYVIGNILRSARYGAITSRLGKVSNQLAAIVFSDAEIFSNLELTQAVYDQLATSDNDIEVPIAEQTVLQATLAATATLSQRLLSRTIETVQGAEVAAIVEEVQSIYRDPVKVKTVLEELDRSYSTK